MLLFKIYNVMFKNKYIIGIVLAILTGFSSCADLDLAPLGSPEAGEISEERQAFLRLDRCLFCHEGLPLHMVDAMFRRRVVE